LVADFANHAKFVFVASVSDITSEIDFVKNRVYTMT